MDRCAKHTCTVPPHLQNLSGTQTRSQRILRGHLNDRARLLGFSGNSVQRQGGVRTVPETKRTKRN